MSHAESFNRIPRTIVDIIEMEITILDTTKDSGDIKLPAKCNGQLYAFEIIAPDLLTDAAFALDMKTPNGQDMLATIGDAIPDNTTTIKFVIDTLRRFLTGQETVQLTCVTDQTSDKVFTLVLYILSVGA